MASLTSVGSNNFAELVLGGSATQPVLVDFWAPWCGPCRALGPTLEQLADEYGAALTIVKLNTDEEPELATRYQIRSIPAVKLFKDGAVATEFVGAQSAAAIRQLLAPHIVAAPTVDPRIEAALSTAHNGQPDEAVKLLDALPPPMQSEPAVLSARATAYFTAIRLAPDETDLIQSTRVRAARHLLAGEFERGIEMLLGAMERNARFARNQGRIDLLAAFDLASSETSLLSTARRRLAALIH